MTPQAQAAVVAAEALSRLAIARATTLDDITLSVYLDALADVSPNVLAEACAELARLPRRDYDSALPSVGTIRERCSAVLEVRAANERVANLLSMPDTENPDVPTFFCTECLDTSWRLFDCAGKGDKSSLSTLPRYTRYPCGRPKSHPRHTFAERCACVPMNPVIAAWRERDRAAKQKRETKS